ncbi:MAG: prepilin-type N-terminal cleavage/methylation domain-containing protein [Candidatus Schekmanbacteria bacterium]|nr:MAG: prepilin-type N-terminal cleavage/methylation domain-containing protein [Candidatus Schekmanbacteria bacterium]
MQLEGGGSMHTEKSDKKSEAAFTLVEILVAIVILSVGLLSIAGLVTTVIRGNAQSKRLTTAISLAQTKIEELKNKSYDDSDLEDSNPANNNDLTSTTSVDHSETDIDGEGNPGGIYTRIWNIADDSPSANMKTITVIIKWNDSGKERKTSFTTVISQ